MIIIIIIVMIIIISSGCRGELYVPRNLPVALVLREAVIL